MSRPVVRVSASERQLPRVPARGALDEARLNLPRMVLNPSQGPVVSHGVEPAWRPPPRVSSGAQSSFTRRVVDVDLPVIRRAGRPGMPVASQVPCPQEQLLRQVVSQPKGMSTRIVCEDMPVIRSSLRPARMTSRPTHSSPLLAPAPRVPKGAALPCVREVSPAEELPVVRVKKASPARGRARKRKLTVEAVPSQVATTGTGSGSQQLAARLPVVTLQDGDAPQSLTKRKKRKSIGSDFESQADLEAAKKLREVEELVELLPSAVSTRLLGGEAAVLQVPDPHERKRILKETVALRAGSDGATLANARRAWESFRSFAQERGLLNDGLPASAALVASYLKNEGERAANGSGAQGGTTVANSRRVGLLWLHEKLLLPIEVDNIVALAAANPGQVRAFRRADPASRKRKQSASLPIQCYLQIETLASAAEESPTRFFARSLFAFSMLQSVRAVDALRTVEDADEFDTDRIISGYSYFSKDGNPMKTFAPATGFLGDLTWWPEHRRAVRAAGRVFPMWDQPYGSGGRVTEARLTPPQGYVMPKAHLTASIKACMMQPPLSMSATEFDELGITSHSEHGSPSDMLTTLGTHSPFGSFLREDVREIGHWLRLGCLEDNLEEGTAGAQGRRRGAGRGRQATGAFANTAAECAASYCEGDGREGRRTAQLRVRRRWIKAVKQALDQYGRPWTELPPGRGSYDILRTEAP